MSTDTERDDMQELLDALRNSLVAARARGAISDREWAESLAHTLDDPCGRIERVEIRGVRYAWPEPIPVPDGRSCAHCGEPMVILGYADSEHGIEVAGAPNYAWAHAADLSRTCTITRVFPVKPYSYWFTVAQERAVQDAVNAAYERRETELDEAEAASANQDAPGDVTATAVVSGGPGEGGRRDQARQSAQEPDGATAAGSGASSSAQAQTVGELA